jgi:hypothetical protein
MSSAGREKAAANRVVLLELFTGGLCQHRKAAITTFHHAHTYPIRYNGMKIPGISG